MHAIAAQLAIVVISLVLAGCQGESPAPSGPGPAQPGAVPAPAPAAAPNKPPAGAQLPIEFRTDTPSAVPEPAAEDRNWSSPGYDPLVPLTPDGKPTFSNVWFKTHLDLWTRQLAHLKGKPGLSYLEVGVFEGQSLVWIFENILTDPSSTGTGIDLFDMEGLEQRFRENLKRAGIDKRVTTLKGFSNDALRGLKPNTFDIIYIDASHTAANALRDGILSWDLLKEGGILIFDDYSLTPRFPPDLRPGTVINSLITAFHKEAQVLHRGWQMFLKKVPNDCWDNCSKLGPYRYFWDFKNPDVAGSGTLFDPRTKARVPLTKDEAVLVETLLNYLPLGFPFLAPPREFWEKPEVQALVTKLKLVADTALPNPDVAKPPAAPPH